MSETQVLDRSEAIDQPKTSHQHRNPSPTAHQSQPKDPTQHQIPYNNLKVNQRKNLSVSELLSKSKFLDLPKTSHHLPHPIQTAYQGQSYEQIQHQNPNN